MTDRLGTLFTAQFSDQRNVGDDLLKGLWLRVRYATVHQYQGDKSTINDFRVIVNYDLSLL